jgi:hypothetical protein
MSNSTSMIGLMKVNSLRDSSASSLTYKRLLPTDYNQTKPGTTIMPNINNSPDVSTTASIVPHFSSTLAPVIPFHILSSTTTVPNVAKKTESIVASTVTNENIQDLVDQLKNCITALNLFVQNKTEHEKHIISNEKSYSDTKRCTTKQSKSLSSSISLTSTSDHLAFSKKSISNKNNLVFEDIAVRRCNSFNNQERKSMTDLSE